MLTVVARRDDTLMIVDEADGPGAILIAPGTTPAVFHKDTALAAGYWQAADGPVPRLTATTITDLMVFNQTWARTQATLESLS